MPKTACLDFSRLETGNAPFPHFWSAEVLNDGIEASVFDWLEGTDAWGLTEADFYTQYEFSLLDVILPEDLQCLITEGSISVIRDHFRTAFQLSSLELVGVTAHKLVTGHRIGIHNDYIGKAETHRLIIQINPHWDDSKGGYLLLFGSSDATHLSKLVKPANNSAFGFAISDQSYHAVSTVYNSSRYSIVYTFKEI
jgi:Rps23 Pro-64 3,4-dihydroxylase Tpa1-like proline 4-hydroxylase